MGVWTAALLLTAAHPAAAQFGMVFSRQKISDTERGFTGLLDNERKGVRKNFNWPENSS